MRDFRKVEEDESKSRAKYSKEWQAWLDSFKEDNSKKSNIFGKNEEVLHKKAIHHRDENMKHVDNYNILRHKLFDELYPSSISSFTNINTTASAQIDELGILTQCISEVAKLFHAHYYESKSDLLEISNSYHIAK